MLDASADPKRSRGPILLGLLLAMFMAAIETTIVSTAMPTIAAELHGLAMYGWISSSYLLASTVLVPVYGKLADLYGRRPVILGAIVLFVAGSVWCGVASSVLVLICARGLQGLGAGGIYPVTLTIVGDLYSLEERGFVQGVFGAVWAIAAIAGPLIGASLVTSFSWRAVFFVNVPVAAVSLLVLYSCLRDERAATRPRIDWWGAIVLTLAALSMLEGGKAWFAGIAGVALLAVFIVIELRTPEPLIALDLFRQRAILVGVGSFALLGAAMMSVIIFTPLYVQVVLGQSPASAGGTIAPMLVAWPISATITGKYLAKTGFAKPIGIGSLLVAVSLVFFGTAASLGWGTSAMRVGTLVCGAGLGGVSTALIVALQAAVGFQQRGVVTGLATFARSMGGAVAVALLGNLGGVSNKWAPAVSATSESALSPPVAVIRQLHASLAFVFWSAAAAGLTNLVLVAFWPRSATTKTAVDTAVAGG